MTGHGTILIKEKTGLPARRWINTVPNDGLIRYMHLGNKERILLTSPKAHSEVLVTKSYDFQKPADARVTLGRLLGVGVLLAEGEEHKHQRKNLMPAFKYHHIRDLYSVFWEKSAQMVNLVTQEIKDGKAGTDTNDKGTVIQFENWLSRCTLDIIGIAGMGFDFNAINNPDTELNNHYRTVFGGQSSSAARMLMFLGMIIPPRLIRLLPLERNNTISDAAKSIRSISRKLIKDKQAALAANPDQQNKDILSVALESGAFTVENLVDQTMTFLAAGHETTATATSWALLELAQRPKLQADLRAEIRAQLPSFAPDTTSNIPMTADLLDKSVPLLHAVCSEVLRYHAPVPMTRRETSVDTSILGHPVPKGTNVFIVPWAVNFSTEQWGADALEFKPERWLDSHSHGHEQGQGQSKAHSGGAESNFSNLTFLHGPRSCIGMSFAKAEFACLLAAVVGRFEFQIADPEGWDIGDVVTGIVARPRGGVKLRMKVVEGW